MGDMSPSRLMPYAAVLDAGFDPVGFTSWLPLSYLQEAEIKHCRLSMLGVLGYIFADLIKLPGTCTQNTPERHEHILLF